MDRIDELEKQAYYLEKENEQLKDSKYNYIELYKQQLGKNNLLQEENTQLNQRIKELVSENTKLQNDLFTDQLQTDESEHQIEKLKNENINLKTQIVDHRVKEYRLLKILNETSDYT